MNFWQKISRKIKDDDQSWSAFLVEMLIFLAIVLFIRFYIFQFFRVSGPSMCPTLNFLNSECRTEKGEFIFVNELLYNFVRDPQRGEIVVFQPPNKKIYYIKRVIGVPGDTIEVENGKVFLSNEKLNLEKVELQENYLSEKNHNRTHASREKFVVPENNFLLFGDNRLSSFDARSCFSSVGCNEKNSPFVSKKKIQGRAEFVIWPFWTWRLLQNHPILF